ncbi:hypothetical protein [Rhizobium sp. RAF56]|jgi:hypothetical protein|uniref:hypothetical protein n=1 Tax=Rhizobium sp. RAF56 TaxID=3233062 RepID=UPI003F963971
MRLKAALDAVITRVIAFIMRMMRFRERFDGMTAAAAMPTIVSGKENDRAVEAN